AAQEGASSITTAGWERGWDSGQAYNGNSPFNCSGCGSFFQVIDLQSQVINGGNTNTATRPPENKTFAVGKAISLSASVLNIKGPIQRGQSRNYSVNIGQNA